MKKMYKRIIVVQILAIIVLLLMAFRLVSSPVDERESQDEFIRERVVKLIGHRGLCSGEQVIAPSGVSYILTAGHCDTLVEGGSVTVITEDGKVLSRRAIAEDPSSDLLLIEGLPGVIGLNISPSAERHQHVRTFTHGKGLDTYSTDGELIQDQRAEIPVGDASSCPSAPKFRVEIVQTLFGDLPLCLLSVDETVSTAKIVPGSSGGPILDDEGRLIGVASAGDGTFSYFVRLSDIKAFLHSY